jgi:hypothetical protein
MDFRAGAVYGRSSDCREAGSGKISCDDKKFIPDKVTLLRRGRGNFNSTELKLSVT